MAIMILDLAIFELSRSLVIRCIPVDLPARTPTNIRHLCSSYQLSCTVELAQEDTAQSKYVSTLYALLPAA